MRISTLLDEATSQLASAGVEEAALDARLLLQHLTAMTRGELVLRGAEELDETTVGRYRRLISQRSHRIPLQHLTGFQEFWSFELIVSPAVLIPRPETEFVLEQVLSTLDGQAVRLALDMCTGSGAIALVLARELGCRVVAADLSETALAVARQNRNRYHLQHRIDLVCSDLFSGLRPGAKYDCIVSNPPYISDAHIAELEPEVALAEPRMALAGGKDGLDCIGAIIASAPAFLQPGGWLFLEIGADQQAPVEQLFRASGQPYDRIEVVPDYAGRPRLARACHAPQV